MKRTLTLGVLLGFGWAAVFMILYIAMAPPTPEDIDSVLVGAIRNILVGIVAGFLLGAITIILQRTLPQLIVAGVLFVLSSFLAQRVMPNDPITLGIVGIYLLLAAYLLSRPSSPHHPTSVTKGEKCENS